MSERFWRQLSLIAGIMSIGMLFALITLSSSIEIKDLDLWLHLKTGQFISQNGYVPDKDVLSCTIAGKPWVNHEWLFQVIIYHIQSTFGYDGLITMQSVVVVITFLILLLLGYNRERQLMTVGFLVAVLLVYQTRFTIRPDIYSLLFFSLYIYIFSRHLSKRWSLYLLVVLQVLWTNMHGFFFFGPLLALIAVFAEWAKRKLPLPFEWKDVGRLTDEEYGRLKIILLFLVLATCVNPLTFKGAWYPLGVLLNLGGDSKIFFKHIYELQKPFTWDTFLTPKYEEYKSLIFISAISFYFNRRKIDISALLVWIVFLLFSLAAIRNLVFFAVAAYLVIMINTLPLYWESIVPIRYISNKFKYLTGAVIKVALMFWMMNFGLQLASNGYFDFDNYGRKSEFLGVSKRSYPYKAVDFLVREKIKGNFFNDFNSGAYLIGRTYPDIKVFIDGRTEVYGSNFFEAYQKIWRDGKVKVFLDFAKRNNITGVFLNNINQEIPKEVLKMFYGLKDWSIVYFDYDAVIFLKQTPANKFWIDRLAIDLNKWEPKPMSLVKLGTKRVDPFPFTHRGYMLEALGLAKPALKEAKMALDISPDSSSAYKIMGKVYGDRKDFQKAFEYFRLAAMYDPYNSQNRLNFGRAYEELKNYKGAIEQYQKASDMDPNNAKAFFSLSRAYALDRQHKNALEILAIAQKMAPKDKIDVKKIYDIIDKNKKARPENKVQEKKK